MIGVFMYVGKLVFFVLEKIVVFDVVKNCFKDSGFESYLFELYFYKMNCKDVVFEFFCIFDNVV